eukprot:CAMPEP_0201575872 /NCGR_PEP_ID=MMETSP0190_2-20130828/21316_1 /ASSEMBLY_ACC=CAM_ASM_000263 /TAXON_ID=37353 /ORGANISM="Rosalina sp." /LENGTH=63 /DNA_ID=CAMNT_0048006041 /DNA_START=196 /DNA_END=387 /DNA_ORIENTATION=-
MSQNLQNMQLVIHNKEQQISELETRLESERILAHAIGIERVSTDSDDCMECMPSEWDDYDDVQ